MEEKKEKEKEEKEEKLWCEYYKEFVKNCKRPDSYCPYRESCMVYFLTKNKEL